MSLAMLRMLNIACKGYLNKEVRKHQDTMNLI